MSNAGQPGKLRLVPVDELPKRTRRSKYVGLVNEFVAARNTPIARVEGLAPGAAASLRKAVESSGETGVTVKTANGSVYLVKG